MATGVLGPVSRIQRRILDHDVGRVAHHRVVLAAQNALHIGQVFAGVGMGQATFGMALGHIEQVVRLDARLPRQTKALPMQQAVANGDVNREIRCIVESVHITGLQGSHQQSETRDGHGKGVQVHARHGIQRLLRHVAPVAVGLRARPFIHHAVKATEQKVTRAAGGVDQAHHLVAKCADGGGQRAVEDEFFDELGRLQQGVAFAGGF